MSLKVKIPRLEDYGPLIGRQNVTRILKKARKLKGAHVAHVNSAIFGGGVAEILSSLTLLMASAGITTEWRCINGRPDFFTITKQMHNALQGGTINLTSWKKRMYEQVLYENSVRNYLDHDFVVIHDPQPLGMIQYYKKKVPWIWRCHIDLSVPHRQLWNYLRKFIERYDAVVFSIKEYGQKLKVPQYFFLPAIDPLSDKNRPRSKKEIAARLAHHRIPTDKPLIVQVSRFDRWKDPEGVILAFKLALRKIDARLVLLGNVATDDPEGKEVFESILHEQSDRIYILSCGDDTSLVSALQSEAAVVLQKSLREGFGLTITEAMWKGTPVIGGNVGGIRYQIEDGVNGFLVNSVEEAAARMVQLVEDRDLRHRLGKRAKETVREKFLMSQLLEQYLDLFLSFNKKSKYH